jgi:arginase
VREGALDWMGMAHMLDVPGAAPELVAAGPRLTAGDVLLLAWGPEQATPHERRVVDELGVARIPVDEVAADPEAVAAAALARLPDRVVVHFDVDVIDFTDVPLSENTGRNEGLPYAAALGALTALLASPAVVGLTITQLNPAHVEEGAGTLERFARDVAAALTG